MISVDIFRDDGGAVAGYKVEGHAKYDEYGRDIICAAVSVLSQTALIALNKVCGIGEDSIYTSIIKDKGYLKVLLPKELEEETRYKADIVLETMIIGIEDLSEQYPEYINFKK